MCHRIGLDNTIAAEHDTYTPFINEHNYDVEPEICQSGCARTELLKKCSRCISKDNKIAELLSIIEEQKNSIAQLQEKLEKHVKRPSFDISDIYHSDKLVKIYTGLQNSKLFNWLYDFIAEKAECLQYYDQKSDQNRRVTRKLRSKKAFFLFW